jgi:hypothetical protein
MVLSRLLDGNVGLQLRARESGIVRHLKALFSTAKAMQEASAGATVDDPLLADDGGASSTNSSLIASKMRTVSGRVGVLAPVRSLDSCSSRMHTVLLPSDSKPHSPLMQGALRALAAVCSRHEDTRREVQSEDLLDLILPSLDDQDADVREAAITCVRNLARSVRILRTCLVDERLVTAVLQLMNDDVACVQRATFAAICNLVPPHSPLPKMLLERNLIERLIGALSSSIDGVPALALCAIKVRADEGKPSRVARPGAHICLSFLFFPRSPH